MKKRLSRLWRLLSLPKNLQLSIMRLTQNEFLIGVTGVILNDRNEVLMCKHIYRQIKWSLPGGYIKGKEHPKEGLVREIEEETGFIVRIGEQLRIRTDRETARLDISFVGSYIGGEFRPSHEVSEAHFFAFENLPLISQNQLLLIKEVLQRQPNIETDLPQKTIFAKLQSLFIPKH
ncbi:hypothetical protein A2Y99_01070 [Candidatus Gottesmanbacteria bacterium RBG_13_37_7]|uniref:Nudix hydrolase domain-containing protein n=1 Tax=Candidatus Gottesmanbacteria bacterium RBG_13_37_7 TaxID=1798369 RepID=A0A1F5YJN3_9BACT|nr:MAG: hypothetical protein A2Y99_01070 [Candidatus Gottesmanbacteria bacterium RBG_13_37_7]